MSILSTSVEYGKIALGYTRRIIAPFFFGITLNWLFAFLFLVGWASAASLWNSAPALLLMAIFFAGFPFLYFWLARGYAIRKGLEYIYKGSEGVVSQVVGLVVASAVTSSDNVESSNIFKKGASGGVKKAGTFIKKIEEKLPRPIRAILKFLLEQMPLQNMIVEVSEEVALKSENLDEIKPKVQEKVDIYVVDVLIGADLSWFWILAVLNIVAMVLSWYFVIGV
ncbi:MAG: hypothetical protein ACPG19_08450 [Saprospiraceae bacterium]